MCWLKYNLKSAKQHKAFIDNSIHTQESDVTKADQHIISLHDKGRSTCRYI